MRKVYLNEEMAQFFSLKMALAVFLVLFSFISARSEEIEGACLSKNGELFSLLPRKVGEYEKVATFKMFSSANLFDHVNGNAHYYFNKGFVCLGIQEYRKDKKAILLKLYQFTTWNGARQIFSDETANNKNKLDIGEDGLYENYYIAFYLKNYFMKIICFDDWVGHLTKVEGPQNSSMANLVELAQSMEQVLIRRTGVTLSSNKPEENVRRDLNKKNNLIVLIGASYAKGWNFGEISGMAVVNKGVSGEQSFEMISRFNADVIYFKPRAVVIWGFINDIFRSKREEIESTIERAKKSYEEMVKLSQENGIIPILATEVTICPRDSWAETLATWVGRLLGKESYQDYVNKHVLAMNQWLREHAKHHDLLLLDLQPVLSGKRGKRRKEFATEDGSHISLKGYEALTLYARTLLENYFKKH